MRREWADKANPDSLQKSQAHPEFKTCEFASHVLFPKLFL